MLGRYGALAWGVVGLGALAVVDQVAVALRFGRHYVVDDQALLWYAAREWAHGHVRQPGYYGQAYGSTFEAIPLVGLRWFGVQPATGLPLTLAVLGVLPWLALGWVALRRGRPLLALLAVATPVVLSTYYSQYVSFFGAGAGRFLAGVALAVTLAWPGGRVAIAVAWALGSFATAIDNSAAIIVGPTLAYGFLRFPTAGRAVAALAGLVPTACWVIAQRAFYGAHPDYDLHHSPPASFSLETLGDSFPHPGRYWLMFAPELARTWVLPLAVAVALLVLLLATRRALFAVPALLALALMLVGLSSAKALDGPSPLLPYARIFLPLPMVIWFLAFLAAESGFGTRWRRTLPAAVATVALLAVSTVAYRAATLDARNESLLAAAASASFQFPVVPAETLERRCKRMRGLARSTGIALVAFTDDRAAAYGCGAAAYGSIRTLFTPYERRTWLLHDEANRSRDGLLVWGVSHQFCEQVQHLSSSCALHAAVDPSDGLVAAVRFRPQSALTFLRAAGVGVRPFGPHCHPWEPTTCGQQVAVEEPPRPDTDPAPVTVT